MPASDLDNPIHASLRNRHASLACGDDAVCRYPADIAPFLGVANGDADVVHRVDDLVAVGDRVYLLGVAPRVPAGWRLQAFPPLAQMVCDTALPVPDGPAIARLDERHRDEVLALTSLVYPHYFRPQTMRLGRYFGIHVDGRLAAMVGERLGGADNRELSAICTHPEFLGRGFARRLTATLVNDTLAQGLLPFLHVSRANPRAHGLYAEMGLRLRREIGFWDLSRE